MTAKKIVYLGGGATRGPGTVASFVRHAKQFSGSEIVLVDLDPDNLELTRHVGQRFIDAEGADLHLSATTDRAAALAGADAVLSSFRPGGFEARICDEKIPLAHGVIGQETQGPGGFFMALRSIHVLQQVVAEMEWLCPNAWLINYTNPINIVSEAITHHSPIRTISLCEGPIYFSNEIIDVCGLDRSKADIVMIGLNHNCWSVRHLYDGQDMMLLIKAAYPRIMADPAVPRARQMQIEVTVTMDSLCADYMQYYYFRDEVLRKLQAAPMSRSEKILSEVPSYRAHYREQATAARPELDPARSRGGIMELELAIDVMGAIFNDENTVLPCNVPNRGAISFFPDDRVVEVPCLVNRHGATPLTQPQLPAGPRGLLAMLSEYQSLAAEAAWAGTRMDGIRALASNPLVLDLAKATVIYDELAAAHKQHLPERLLH